MFFYNNCGRNIDVHCTDDNVQAFIAKLILFTVYYTVTSFLTWFFSAKYVNNFSYSIVNLRNYKSSIKKRCICFETCFFCSINTVY
jgi:hypothetical protein